MRDIVTRYASFTEVELTAFEAVASQRTFKKNALISREGEVFDKLYFVKSGIVRSYRLIEGQDFTYFFFFANEFAVDFQSYLTQTQSPFFLEALAETEVYFFPKSDIDALYERYPKFEKIGRLMAENAYLSAADRLKQHQTDDLKTRYLNLISKSPNLFQSVPQHFIASYLGVKPQSLSRIKAEISGKKY